MYARAAYAFRTWSYATYARGNSGGTAGPPSLSEMLDLVDTFTPIMIYKTAVVEALALVDNESTVIRMPLDELISLLDSFASRKGWIPEIPLPPTSWTSE